MSKPRIFQEPGNPNKLIAESPNSAYTSILLIIRNERGEICSPFVVIETTMIRRRGGMEPADIAGKERHRRWAIEKGTERAKEMAVLEKRQHQHLQGELL